MRINNNGRHDEKNGVFGAVYLLSVYLPIVLMVFVLAAR